MPRPEELIIEVQWDTDAKSVIGLAMTELQHLSERILVAVQRAALERGFHCGEIGVRISTDQEIRAINRRHLQHDYSTDVVSFPYSAVLPRVEGELIVSVETARRTATVIEDWSTAAELLLYVVHGVLHLCGMEDADECERQSMRVAEHKVLAACGIMASRNSDADASPTVD
jgi:probable rRNA maturation factor